MTEFDDILLESDLPYPVRRGKVRDVYELTLEDGTEAMALVATDRISAFDVVMPGGIPGKGRILTAMSRFWFEYARAHLGPEFRDHLITTDADCLPGLDRQLRASVAGRVTIGRRAEVVPIECVVRGYLAGSGWKAYAREGAICGVTLPPGLRQGDRLPEPIFTPATKREEGHDQNIDFEAACRIAGEATMRDLRARSIALYRVAAEHAAARGVLIADTKFEFGFLPGEKTPILVDELLTPDSSRFWPAERYEPGREQPSFDKQFVRDYLESEVEAGRWDRAAPAPALPEPVVAGTCEKYLEAARRLMSPS